MISSAPITKPQTTFFTKWYKYKESNQFQLIWALSVENRPINTKTSPVTQCLMPPNYVVQTSTLAGSVPCFCNATLADSIKFPASTAILIAETRKC